MQAHRLELYWHLATLPAATWGARRTDSTSGTSCETSVTCARIQHQQPRRAPSLAECRCVESLQLPGVTSCDARHAPACRQHSAERSIVQRVARRPVSAQALLGCLQHVDIARALQVRGGGERAQGARPQHAGALFNTPPRVATAAAALPSAASFVPLSGTPASAHAGARAWGVSLAPLDGARASRSPAAASWVQRAFQSPQRLTPRSPAATAQSPGAPDALVLCPRTPRAGLAEGARRWPGRAHPPSCGRQRCQMPVEREAPCLHAVRARVAAAAAGRSTPL
jgi:hypothetical protein